MKRIQWIPGILIAFAVFTSFNCNKTASLPEFYFSCLVDGELYIPNGCANCRTVRILEDAIFMVGANRGFESVRLGINDRDSIGVKEYVLNEVIGRQGAFDNSPAVDDIFITNAEQTGVLNITGLNKKDKVVEGIFYFKAYNPVQVKTVHVTQGKFRLKYTDY